MKRKTIIGVVIVLLLAAAIGVMAWRNLPVRSSGPQSELELGQLPAQFHAALYDEWITPNNVSVSEIARQVEEIVKREAEAAGVSEADQLADEVSDRVDLLLEPDYGEWVKAVARAGGTIPAFETRVSDEAFLERWTICTTGIAGAPVSPKNCRVRVIAPDADLDMKPGTGMMRPRKESGAAQYPQPPKNDPSVQAVEVLVPIRFRSTQSESHDLPATAAIRMFRNSANPDWRPYDFIVYFDNSSSGKERTFPIF